MIMRALDWLKQRYDLSPVEHLLKEKMVPSHRYTFFYFFGGATLFFFTVQVVSGIFLLLYYRNGAAEAYDAVRILAASLRQSGPNRARLRDALAAVSAFPGASGGISFDHAGNGAALRVQVHALTHDDGGIRTSDG